MIPTPTLLEVVNFQTNRSILQKQLVVWGGWEAIPAWAGRHGIIHETIMNT